MQSSVTCENIIEEFEKMRSILTLVTFIFVAAAGQVSARALLELDVVNKSFGDQRSLIIKTIDNDNDYVEITQENRTKLVEAMNRLALTFEDGKTFSAISSSEKQQVMSDQELVNLALDQARKDSRLECRREKTLGTNLPTRICLTVAARKRQYQITQDNSSGRGVVIQSSQGVIK
jgi:hypothetical protein